MAATVTGRPPFEAIQPAPPSQTTTYATLFNSNTINPKQSVLINSKTIAKLIEIIHGEPTITFSMKERQDVMIEEGLHQAVVFKLSHGAPDLKGFPRSIGYNPKEETTLTVVWISLPNLSPDLFAKKSLLSIASAVGKPIAIDKVTQIKSRPSTARFKVILDLMEKLPNRIRLQFVDEKSGKLIEKQNNKQIDDTIEIASKGTIDSEKYQGDAREILNEKIKQNRAHSMDVVTSNISVQTTTENKGKTPRVGVDAQRVGSGKKIMDSGHKLMDTSNVEDAENSGQHILQVETKNATKNWTLNATGNFHDGEKRQDISNASRDLLCSNNFDVLSKTTGKQVKLTENDNDLIQEKQDSLDKDGEDMLDICFDRVAREGDISPRQPRSGNNKSKKKTHGRQHSWDGKMTEEFVPRHLSMRRAKQNHLTTSSPYHNQDDGYGSMFNDGLKY
ncbi:hypothetical protein H5410_032280 [Solanum commersonii]|uniref:DUF4283 domain-containing protein n=1 Tax=Solanum commersonii TaxID=4109 RepID=A0A9J5YPW7_SOLCO|nr:hypothetical protein H5410_032280 [Solanum commersonii]